MAQYWNHTYKCQLPISEYPSFQQCLNTKKSNQKCWKFIYGTPCRTSGTSPPSIESVCRAYKMCEVFVLTTVRWVNTYLITMTVGLVFFTTKQWHLSVGTPLGRGGDKVLYWCAMVKTNFQKFTYVILLSLKEYLIFVTAPTQLKFASLPIQPPINTRNYN